MEKKHGILSEFYTDVWDRYPPEPQVVPACEYDIVTCRRNEVVIPSIKEDKPND